MQLAIPAISYKLFEKRYKKVFEAGEDVTRCYICKNPIKTGQEVTTQCGHKDALEMLGFYAWSLSAMHERRPLLQQRGTMECP